MGPLPDRLSRQTCGHQGKNFPHSRPEEFSNFFCGGRESSGISLLSHIFKRPYKISPKATSCLSNLLR